MEDDNQQTQQPEPTPQTQQPTEWPKPNTSGDLITRGLTPNEVSKPKIPDNIKGK